MLCLDKNGYPVELIKGYPIKSFIRKLIHTRSFCRGTIGEWNRMREVELKRKRVAACLRIQAKIDRQREAARKGLGGCSCEHRRDNVRDPIQQAALKNANSFVTKPACRKVADDQGKCQG